METTLETAVTPQGRAHRKTMKCLRLDPLAFLQGRGRCASNDQQRRALPPVESKVETSVESINDAPMVETLQPHRLPVPPVCACLRLSACIAQAGASHRQAAESNLSGRLQVAVSVGK